MGFAPWQHRFGGARDVVGRTLVLNGTTFTVVGVAPERFRGVTALFRPDLWIPSTMAEQVLPAQQRGSLRDREALVFRGVRMALGAGERSMVALVLRQGIRLVAAGIGLGLLGSLLAGRALSGLLHGLSPADPVTLVGAAAVLLAVATLACYLPARDASRVDPLVALREA